MPDLGESIQGRKVTQLIAERLPVTLLLNVLAIPLIVLKALFITDIKEDILKDPGL